MNCNNENQDPIIPANRTLSYSSGEWIHAVNPEAADCSRE
jgi:hypothetical protein